MYGGTQVLGLGLVAQVLGLDLGIRVLGLEAQVLVNITVSVTWYFIISSAVTISLFPTSIDLEFSMKKDRDFDRFRFSHICSPWKIAILISMIVTALIISP